MLLLIAAACALAAAEATILPAEHQLLDHLSIPVQWCPQGGSLEAGLCYQRCRPGWKGLGCSCWQGRRSYRRGCGARPLVCHSRSYRRRQRLPAVQRRGPFSLALTADPQLFRVTGDVRDVETAGLFNTRLVQSVNNVTQLRQWPWQAGGGSVQQPEALVLLGDMTESYRLDELDAYRRLYDPSMPAAASGDAAESISARITLPTWHMLGNHDLANNAVKGRMPRAQQATDTMRAVLTPGCDTTSFSLFPRENVTSFDAPSMSYAFDYDRWHFVVLQYSPRYSQPELSISSAMGWLAGELSTATAQQRHIVLLLHAHAELGLPSDPTFARLLRQSSVVALFYGHVHIRPWGLTGVFPNTSVPVFNCGASWYHVHCLAEFGEDSFRVAAVVHDVVGVDGASGQQPPEPRWFGTSVHSLPKAPRAKPVLQQLSFNPQNGAAGGWPGVAQQWLWGAMLALALGLLLG